MMGSSLVPMNFIHPQAAWVQPDLIYVSQFLLNGPCALSLFSCSLLLLPVSLSFCSTPAFAGMEVLPQALSTQADVQAKESDGSDISRGLYREYLICSHDAGAGHAEGLAAPRALHALIPLPAEPGKPQGWDRSSSQLPEAPPGTKGSTWRGVEAPGLWRGCANREILKSQSHQLLAHLMSTSGTADPSPSHILGSRKCHHGATCLPRETRVAFWG